MKNTSLRFFQPIISGAQFSDRWRACLGAMLGVAFTILTGQLFSYNDTLPAIAAPLGASAVLAFAVPASPLAQPWPILGGNIFSALVGVTIYKLVPDSLLAATLAVGAAIFVMSLLRCLHPPGGAMALSMVISGKAIHQAGYAFAILPVGINCIALLIAAHIYHRFSGHSYPHKASPLTPSGLHMTDIDAALEDMHESFDISREDLDALLTRAEHHAAQRLRKN